MVGASQQSIRNGRDTLFWTSKWIDSEVVLADHATVSLSDVEKERTVAEATSLDGGWDWAFLKDHLPEDIIRLVAGMEPPMTEDREDELIWGPGPKGKFSIKSAYEILDCISNESADNIWKTIWKWEGPNRVKHFIWLAAHERILTNSERCRRHIAQDSTCYRCPNICEDLLHVCRDCNLAKEVWMSLFPHRASGDFFALNFQDWWQTIRSIHNWLAKEWEVRVSHVFREANRVADLLAHHGHNLDFGISVDCAYPSVIDREIWNDFIGASSPRVILFND
ncbi:Putative ribonuclease H protein At1g65750 [Linum perenne]